MAATEQQPLPANAPLQVHFVGSVPLLSSEDVFQRLATTFPNQLCHMPDGETEKRYYFVLWQRSVFDATPTILADHHQVPAELKVPIQGPIKLNPLEYDDYALTSYADFRKLRERGVILAGVRFQVCLPTPFNVIMLFIDSKYQAEVEVLYEKALLAALRRIQDHIPKEDLAIQWDAAIEFAAIEGVAHPFFPYKPWFLPLKEGLEERFKRLAAAVDEGVELGFHLCYGDVGHKHFVEPKDAGNLVEVANVISGVAARKIDWVHMPVPKNRLDDEYYAPLKQLRLKKETKVFLGLAHAWDVEGTQKRIEVARKVLDDFGIATECGMGRTPKDEFDSVIDVLAMISAAATKTKM